MYYLITDEQYVYIMFENHIVYKIFKKPIINPNIEPLQQRSFPSPRIMPIINGFEVMNKTKNPTFNLDFFYSKINSTFIYYDPDNNKTKYLGVHNELANSIMLFGDNGIDSLNHELYHLSSAWSNDDLTIRVSGFSQCHSKERKIIFSAINEGQTAYLDQETFNHSYHGKPYDISAYIMKTVANEIGKDNLIEFYSNMDLAGLLENLNNKGLLTDFVILASFLEILFNEPNLDKLIEVKNYLIDYEAQRLNENVSDNYLKELLDTHDYHLTFFQNRYGKANVDGLTRLKTGLEKKLKPGDGYKWKN